MSAPTDEQLLQEHLNGSDSAFREIVQRHHREVFQFVFRFTNRRAAAEDITQDTFLQVHLAGASFDTTRRLKPWLFTIAANKARDYLRSRSRKKEVPLDAQIGGEQASGQTFLDLLADEIEDPTGILADKEQAGIVRRVIDELPPHLSEILLLAYFHQIPYKDIADSLEIPIGTVKSRLHAAVNRFAKDYRECAHGLHDP